MIDAVRPYPQLVIHLDGIRLPAGWAPALPAELRPMLNPSWFSSWCGDEPLQRYLDHSKHRFPIVLKTSHESIVLQWTPSVQCRSKTEIAVEGAEVKVRAVCVADGIALDRIVRFRNFVADVLSPSA